VQPGSFWITGAVQSGKTTRLVDQFQTWVQPGGGSSELVAQGHLPLRDKAKRQQIAQSILVFATNADNRIELANQISRVTAGKYAINSTTPLGFFEDEVVLFWPLLIQQLNLKANFPLRLRPENEQELATQLWHQELSTGLCKIEGVPTQRLVRQALDLLQLAAFSGTSIEEVPLFLRTGFAEQQIASAVWDCLGGLLVRWRDWCLKRGFLTYGILTELYWRHLLPLPAYQQHLRRRFRAILADDVDNYPAIARDLFEFLLDQGAIAAFTYNPDGAIRLGLGADPAYMLGLSQRCSVKQHLAQQLVASLGGATGASVVESLTTPSLSLPESIQSLQTISRAQLLRQTGEVIIQAIRSGQIEPQEIAVIGPGLDAIARYALAEILTRQGIPVISLNDQRPLNSSPIIRALLTLLALVYPGSGRLIEREHVAEMLVIISLERQTTDLEAPHPEKIDPVRAGLLADYCFQPHPEHPQLLPATTFPRWDCLGYEATAAYEALRQWLEQQRAQQEQHLIPSPISVLDRAIQRFLWPNNLAYDQLAALRELIETAQHYWEVDHRLRQTELINSPDSATVSQFIHLLRTGTITANPFPVRSVSQTSRAVMLATTFQYRTARQFHRWHFWLDAGSSLWHGGGAVVLWGAPLFLKHWSKTSLTIEDTINDDQEQLRRLLLDLLSRVKERVYLCHSDLSVSGQEQVGPLLPLVDAASSFKDLR
jgi:hypothetical protein